MRRYMETLALVIGLGFAMSFTAFAGAWQKDTNGWWYRNDNGSYPRNTWQQINGAWYCFDDNGYMLHDTWSGDFYLGSNGAMLTNTITPDGYKVGEDGRWIRGDQRWSVTDIKAAWNGGIQKNWEKYVANILYWQNEFLPSSVRNGILTWVPAEASANNKAACLIKWLFYDNNPYDNYFVKQVNYGMDNLSEERQTVQAAMDYFGVDIRNYPDSQFHRQGGYYYTGGGDFGADIPAARTEKVSFANTEVTVDGLCAIQSDEDRYERYDHRYTLTMEYHPEGVYSLFRLKKLVITPY